MIKKLLIAVAVAALLLTGVMFFVRGSLDGLVKDGIEHYGSAMTGASVKVGKVEIRTTDGQCIISNMEIGNPAGFKTSHALKVARIDVAVDMSTLTNDAVLIRKIEIAAPDIIYEKGDTLTNFDAIQKNIAAYLGPAKPEEKNTGGKKLIVGQFLVLDAKAQASAPILAGKTVVIPLPDIALKDIGKAKGGVTPGELGQVITSALKKKLTAGFSFDSLTSVTGKVGSAIKGLFQ
ncbi:MAG: hypothetical protein PHP70_09205 [Gallionella sp.]|nr:hypothetical protein [Gallionella sp.]